MKLIKSISLRIKRGLIRVKTLKSKMIQEVIKTLSYLQPGEVTLEVRAIILQIMEKLTILLQKLHKELKQLTPLSLDYLKCHHK
jgi:hypothetical protein